LFAKAALTPKAMIRASWPSLPEAALPDQNLPLDATNGLRMAGAAADFAGAAPAATRGKIFQFLTCWRVIPLAQGLDIITILGAAAFAFCVTCRHGGAIPWQEMQASCLVAATAFAAFRRAGTHALEALMDPVRCARALALRWLGAFVLVAALAALAHDADAFSRLWFGMFFVAGGLALGIERLLIARLIRAWIYRGHHTLRVAVIGGNELAAQLIARFKDNPWGIHIIGVFDDRSRDNVRHIGGVPVRGVVADLLDYARQHGVDTVVLTIPLTSTARIMGIVKELRQQPFNIRVLPGALGLERISPIRLARNELPGVQLITLAERPVSGAALLIKASFDRVAAAALLLAGAPVLLTASACIKFFSPGPVLFRQKRIGYRGREFEILKFRTMHQDVCGSTRPTMRNDDRVFRFGKWLRATSLDELPQLLNVLKGDMSLVGPRPHMTGQQVQGRPLLDAVSAYADRQRVKPGMTGWAQVNGWRGPVETIEQIERRVEHDIYYIENWSLLLDLIILAKTATCGFYGKNAF
jgi:Undecaprenyl-phosphate glucose phosphotransferase